jgi:hypothetical protein
MELRMQSHSFTRRMPDWRAAAVAGFAAGMVFLALELLMALMTTGSAWGPPRMIAAIVLGRGVLPPPASFSLSVLCWWRWGPRRAVVHFRADRWPAHRAVSF